MICDLPSKFFSCIYLNTPLYFLSNLRREAGPFFVFLLFGFSSTVVLSMVLRLMGHLAPNVYQGLAPYSFIVIGMVVYTGFVLPSGLMREWLRWLNKVNPIAYAYESLVINELSGRNFPCTQFVPPYPNTPPNQRTCSTPGSAPGTDFVNGDTYIQAQLGYSPSHLWRSVSAPETPVTLLRSVANKFEQKLWNYAGVHFWFHDHLSPRRRIHRP